MSRSHASYPLSPMQAGMLFHALYAPRAGVDVEQMVCALPEALDVRRFHAAWQHVVAEREVLRTAFRWEGLDAPEQHVAVRATVPFEVHDLRMLDAEDHELLIQQFLAEDRARGFDLARAPLMRLTLVRTADEAYRFVWTFHHILIDGRSFPLVIQDVFAAYDALGEGRAPALPERRAYGDFIAWLGERDEGASDGFWRDLMAGFRAPTPLLGGGEAHRVEEIEYGERRLSLTREETSALVAFGKEHGLTLNTLLQGAWSLLLARYAGEDDVVFGATRAGRRTALGGEGTDAMLGVFINTPPMRVPVPGDMDVVAWLREIQRRGRAQRDHEHTPLVRIHAATEVPKSAPLFETLFVFEDKILSTVLRRLGGAWEKREAKIVRKTSFPLALIAYGEDELLLEVEHDRRRFDDATADAMLGHLATILRAFVEDPARRLADVPMLDDAERHRIVVAWNETAEAPPPRATLHALFEAQVDRTPDAIALVDGERRLSYAELDRRANKLASHLARRGVGVETLVGLCAHRSADLVIALLAVLKAGGAYVPLDPAYPAARLAQILEDAKAPFVITEARVKHARPDLGAGVILLDQDAGTIAAEPDTRPASGARPESLAYVIYTSGSTGKPKGVAIEHRSTAALIAWAQGAYTKDEIEGVLFATSVCFDLSLFELFLPLASGTKLILAENALALPSLPAKDEVTLVNTVPTAIAELVRTGGLPASARTICLAGEPLTATLTSQIHAIPTVARVDNLYGPTEDTTYSTWTTCPRDGSAPTVGRPIAWGQAYILDARMEPVAAGVAGEIYLGGEGLARGYLGRPDLTEERFVPSPFIEGARLYKTGDLGRFRSDGQIEFLGRADFQVKVRGFRIELGEIEAVLLRHEGVRETVVVARDDGAAGDKRVVAYVAPGADRPSVADLRAFVKERLPEYMVPSAFVLLDALPLTPNGKVDRKALPAPEGAIDEGSRVAPRGPIEEAIAAIFAEVLRVPSARVGAHDGFFDLGGHSLLATQAISRVRDALGVVLPLRALFDAPTVSDLAARVEAAWSGAAGAIAPLAKGEGPPVLSFAAERLWVLDQLEPGDPTYVILRATRLRGALDRGALGRSLTEIVNRHEVLRTTIGTRDGRPEPALREAAPVPVDVTHVDEAALGDELAAEAKRTFDLESGPLLRARLLSLGATDHVLVVTMHHIVSDAWTLGVFADELGALYGAFAKGEPSPLAPLSIQYADYARWQRERLAGEVLDRELSYWKKALEGAPYALDLPSDRRRPPVESHRGARMPIAIGADVARSLADLCRREGVTPFMALLAAFEVMIQRSTGQTDFLVGTPVANRAHAATEKLCGLFLNTLVMRAEAPPETPFRDLLRRVREAALGAYSHQDLPFERLVTELSPERDRSRSPLFQVMFTLQNAASGALALPGVEASPVSASIETSKFDLTLILTDRGDGLGGFFEYATDLFDASTIERWAGHFTALLASAIAAPDRAIGDLAMLSGDERQRVLVENNATAHEHPEDRLIHEIFADQVLRAPDAIALRFEGRDVSYVELDERSNQLAHALRERGVGSDVLVGVFCERSVEMLVALYGVLKAGGAYVPLDPDYPRDRLAFMLEDAAPRVILTQPHLADRLPASSAELVRLDADWDAIAKHPTTSVPRGDLALGHLAYVIYTSGSTGKPKGAMNEHRGILNRIQWMQRAYHLGERDVVLQKTPFSFDVSVWELFWPLMFGARLVLAKPDGHRDPSYLADLIRSEGVTTLHFVPSMLAAFLEEPSVEQCSSIVRVMASGEALPPALAERFFAKLPRAGLFNLYGPTEAAVDVTAWACKAGDGIVPIGKPIDNVQIYILDARLSPAPIGVAGDLYIAGVQVGRGYLNRPELTAERFVRDPFASDDSARMYKTGDVARWLPDGAIEYLGRSDFQVKIRGFRIELGEIEAALLRHASVREAVVVAREDQPGNKRLVAYLVASEGEAPTAADLRAFLKGELPDHMVPSAFVMLDALPLTASGKVDRKALPAPDEGDRIDASAEYAAPRTPLEDRIATIWAGVLRVDRVGVHDNFFELGGDSILGIQIVARAQQARIGISPRHVFEHQTIAELAEVASVATLVTADQGPVTGTAALTPIQRWWLDQDLADPHHYNQAMLLDVGERVDAAAMEAAIGAILTHHDALRLRLVRDAEGAWIAFADPGGKAPFARVDLAALAEGEQKATIEAKAALAQASLDPTHGPVLRAVLFDLGDSASRLFVAIHHLAVDGVSWRILLDDLWTAYAAAKRGAKPSLPAKTTSLKRWSELLVARAQDSEITSELDHWRNDDRRRARPLPVDAQSDAGAEGDAKSITVTLSPEETSALLREVPAAYRTQINDVLLTAVAEALAPWAGSVAIDIEGHGREDLGAESDPTRTVGWFTTIFPVVLDVAGTKDPGEALRTVKEALRAIPSRGLGYGLLRWVREASRAPLAAMPQAEVMFNYLGQVDQVLPEGAPLRLAAESSGPAYSPKARRRYAIDVLGRVRDGRLVMRWTYSEPRHRRETIEALADRFVASLRGIIAHCVSPDAGGSTPSDFAHVKLTQAAIDMLASRAGAKRLDDVYPLSALQHGILFHALYAAKPEVYVVELAYTLRGALDAGAFRRAWQAAMDRHPVLRTSFAWERIEEPLQIVHERVEPAIEIVDLRAYDAAEQDERVRVFIEEERRKGFDLTRAPLTRLSLLRLGDEEHRFVWTSHHMLLDGWSTQIVMRDVLAFYEAFSNGYEPRPERARPFVEYVSWLRGQDASRSEGLFRNELTGFGEPTPLAVDRPPVGPERFDNVRAELSLTLSTAIAQFARRHRLTSSTILQGAWALLLSRYSGEDDVLFGATVSGRSAPVPGIERMVGLFINSVPVRVRVDPDARAAAWLGALQAHEAVLREHEHTPLVDAQGWSEIPRGTPLFESLVVFENYPFEESVQRGTAGLAVSDVRSNERPPYPITVVGVFKKRLMIRLGYDARRFERGAIERMHGHLTSLLEALVERPDERLAALPMLREDERTKLLVTWNDTALAHPISTPVHTMIEAQVARTPDAIAVKQGDATLTYDALNRRANQLARYLGNLGLGPGGLVGLCLRRTPDLVVAVLAILKSGAAYVALDPSYPIDRLSFMLEDSAVPIVVTEQAIADEMPSAAMPVLVDADAPMIEAESDEDPGVAVSPDDLAYVIYTSGSTGRPKGVLVRHGGLANYLAWATTAYGADAGRGALVHSSIAFDLTVTGLFTPLLAGKTVELLPEEREIEALVEALGAGGYSLVKITPAHLEVLNRMMPRERAAGATQAFVIGGEQLSWEALAFWQKNAPGTRLINEYGPTETVVGCCTYEAQSGSGASAVPIGKPIASTRLFVLDRRREPVPIGVPGELYIGGAGVARGYLNRPDLTEERFVPDPFGDDPEARLYKTGDLVRWQPDGVLEFISRIDNQVKIRGFRIELGEIEAVLGQHSAVGEVAVIAREDAPGDKRLVAYVVAREDSIAPEPSDLKRFLGERMPDYMVPSAFVSLPELPLTSNGKVDRKALPAPEGRTGFEGAYVAPRNAVEEALASIWADVLGVPRVGAHDDFFELGGHSLLATQVVGRIVSTFHVELPLQRLFDSPTVAKLAEHVQAMRDEGEGLSTAPIVRIAREGDLALSFGQERLWFLAQLDPTDPSWVVPLAMRLRGSLDVDALARALGELVRRHEVLRTTFSTVDGRPVQIIHEPAPVPLPSVSYRSMGPDELEEMVREEHAREASEPFDLAKGPLLRTRLLSLGDDDHVLFLTMHHIVSDAWTVGVMNREIGVLYEAFSKGRPSSLPDLAVQYVDYARWQRAWLDSESFERQLAYWKGALANAPASLDVPTDRPRPPVRSNRGQQRRFALSADVTRGLRELARREGVTLYMMLLSIFDVLLYRYTGQTDVVVGSPIAGRTRAETENLIGFFLNTLVMRAPVDPEEPFEALLRRVRDVCFGAYGNQDMPFERLVQELRPDPDPSRSPLFQVIFNLQNAPADALSLPGLTIERVRAEITTVKADVTLIMTEEPNGVRGALSYATDLFDPATMDRFIACFQMLAESVVRAPSRRIAELSMLTEDERRTQLVTWNETAASSPPGETIHGMFEATAKRTPFAIAVSSGGSEITFQQLDTRANRLARHLRGLGVGPDAVVGLCMDRSIEVVIAILGILKAGGAYVPLDPSYPKPRLAQIVEDAGARVVVTRDSLAPVAPTEGVTRVRIDGDQAAIDVESGAPFDGGASPEGLVYVLFTSGSTGKPKGVAIEHRNLVNYVRGVSARLGLSESASYAHVSTFSADLGNTSLFPPLCLGGTLHVIGEDLTKDPDGLADYMHGRAIDCLKIVPSHLAALLSGAHPERVIPKTLLVFGGEGLPWDLVDRVEQLAPGTRILNHYGPTETTVGVLTFAVPRGLRLPTQTVPLGRPLARSRAYILDASLTPVPVGVPGELFIAGGGVARGYVGRADLTAERFLRDPFVSDPNERMYRTGDRARYLADGSIVFLGRVDHQVKIRGFRVELGEIEAAINGHAGIRESVVLVQEDTPGDKRLIAYVVPRPAEGPSIPDLKKYLGDRLPEYMVPPSIHLIDAVPLNANGKIDRQALAALEIGEAEAPHVAPRTEVEELLLGIWVDVFERERISVHDRFADLGGHSLLAIQIIARAREAFDAEVPLRAIFEAPTIAGLAERIEIAMREGDGEEAPPVVRVSREEPLPLSFSQERLWFLDQLEPGSAAYNVPIGLRISGVLDARALERALIELTRRHEVLRTTFATVDGKPTQVVHASIALRLAVEDLTSVAADKREAVARREGEVEAQRPFDLAKGPLLRARLLRLGDTDHVLLLTVHHIVTDAWTRGILAREIAALYASIRDDRPHHLADLPVQYADYASWQRRYLTGETLDRLLGYWTKQLSGAPAAIELPTDRPRPPVQSGRGARRSLDMPLSLAESLADLARREGATLFMTALAAFDVLLYRYTNQGDLSIGTPVANRTRPETEGLLGFFVNTLVLRTTLDGEMTFKDLLARVRESCLASYAHQEMPFERLVTELAPERDLSRPPLFQVMFTLQNEPLQAFSLSGLDLSPFSASIGTAKFDLLLAMTQGPKALHALVEFATDLFDPSTIERMLGHLQVILEGIVENPDRRLRDLPILPEAERQRLLASPVAPEREKAITLHGWFERQVDRTPDAPAATFEGETLSYRQLDARANQVARHLVKLGVGPEVLVGLSVDRSMEMLVGLLGILKAGGAYLPLDPEYPRDRIAFMVEDAKAPVVLTQSRVVEALPDHGATKVLLDADWETIAKEPEARLGPRSAPRNLAYVIYTSGSTGKPKGAMVEHDNVVRLFESTEAWYRFGASDVWTMFHSYAFDFSVWEIWGALLYGGRLVIVPYWVSRNPEAFHELMGREGVTVLNQTPSAFRQLVRVDEEAKEEAREKLRLRYVIFGGEALDLGDLRPWWARHGDQRPSLVNMYGITETTVHVTYRPVGKADLERPWSSVIGEPIPDLRVYILDAARQPVPIGVPGEMYVGGAGVARGYLNRPDLTADRFLDDPFSPGGKLYKTGDLARTLASGDIEYLGRIDHQVKIRGFRIELGEIEAVLDTHAAVREAVVIAREESPGDKRLVAYLVCREGQAPSAGDLRAFVKQKLPDMMVPAAFVLLDALPLTSNGKVDRKALPAPEEGERAAAGAEYAAPTTHAEEELVKIWSAVLRLDKLGIHDNFFELGGDSILSIQIVARAREAGVNVTPRQIFEHQTIAELAAAASTTEIVVAEQGPVTGPVRLTPVQTWWLAQGVEDPHHHNQAMFLDVKSTLDAKALEAAVGALLDHHDMLRLRVTRGAKGFEQIITPPGAPPPVSRVDLTGEQGAAQTAAIERETARAQASLDLERGPILRVVQMDVGPSASRLFLAIHHMAVDGVSWRILLQDLWSAYGQASRGEAITLPPKTTSFPQWAEKLSSHARSDTMRDEEAYWLADTRGGAGRLPRDEGGENLESSARAVTHELTVTETEQLLREVPEVYRTQVNDVLLTAFAEAMAPWVGSQRVLVDMEGHGREEIFPDADMTRTVGWFTAIYPVAIDIDPSMGHGKAIQSVKEQLRAIPSRGLGYGLLRYLREGEIIAERLASLPQAEVSFNYLGQLDQALPDGSPFTFARESVGPGYSPRARRAYVLDVQGGVRGGRLRIRVAYSKAIHHEATIEALVDRFVVALRGLIAHCLSPEAGGYTPSDFQKADLSQEDIGDLLDQLDDEEE